MVLHARRRPAAAPLLGLAFLGFISLGLPDGLLGVAWPSIRQSFGLPLDALGALLLALVASSSAASLSSGWVVARLGVGRLLALSSLATAVGLLGYALAPGWAAMVALGVVAGLGAGAIDAGLNAYVALHHSPRTLNWLHASYGLGAAIGPAIMLAVLGSGLSWRWGYAGVGLLQVALGSCFLLTAGRWPGRAEERAASDGAHAVRALPTSLRRSAVVWCSVALFLVYTGLEVTAGQWSYSLFTESRGAAPEAAGLAVSVYWGGLAFGRLLFGFVANRVDPVLLVRACMLTVLAGGVLIWRAPGEALGFVGLGLIGLAEAPIFPALIAGTPRRVGPARAADVIGFQVGAAAIGIAILPGVAGLLAERFGLETIAPFLVLAALTMILLHEAIVSRAA